MLQFRVNGPVPRVANVDTVYCISSRDTQYGVHRQVFRSDLETFATKTCLVCFRDRGAAARLCKVLHRRQRDCMLVDGELSPGGAMVFRENKYGRPVLPTRVEPRQLRALEELCLLHFIDLLLVTDLSEHAPNGEMALDCLEFVSTELPGRATLTHRFECLFHDG
jgi:hypothetical protein